MRRPLIFDFYVMNKGGGRRPNRQGKSCNDNKSKKKEKERTAVFSSPPVSIKSGFRAEIARSFRGFLNGPKLMHQVAMPPNEELCGTFEVVRLMGLFARFHGDGLLVSKVALRPIGYEEACLPENAASMAEWIGIVSLCFCFLWLFIDLQVHMVLSKSGSVVKAADLFSGRLRSAFLKTFPSPGPLLKQGVAEGVLFALKIPGCVFVQLKNVDLSRIDEVSEVACKPELGRDQRKDRKTEIAPKSHATSRVIEATPTNFARNQKKPAVKNVEIVKSRAPVLCVMEPLEMTSNQAPDFVAELPAVVERTKFWVCEVCEQENDLLKFPLSCEVCLVDREIK